MRPIELTISAFGPYAGTTTLRFDALGTQRLFVITGPTGSGKTTLFEAILYALYGTLSKRGMDPSSLRCDFLKPGDDTVTYVDFTFDIGGKIYKIHRQPKQRVAKKRGDGTREIGQEAVLECVGHDAFLPLSKISEVDRKITELVGLDDEQFQKIVMLPQGAFQEFLASTTKDKMELLRHIFDTSIYDLALQKVKSRVTDMTGAYNDIKTSYRSQAAMLRFSEPFDAGDQPSERTLNDMEALLASDAAQSKGLEQAVDDGTARYQDAVQRLNQEKQHNADVEKWQQAQQALQRLQAQKPAMDAVAARVSAADCARSILDQEKRAQETDLAKQAQARVLTTAAKRQEETAAALAQAKTAQEKAEQKKLAADQQFQQLPALTAQLEKMKDYVAERAALAQAREQHAQAQAASAALEQSLSKTVQEVAALESKVQEKTQTQEAHHRLQMDCETKSHQLEQERRHYNLADKYLKAQAQRAGLKSEAQQAEAVFAQAEERLQAARAHNRQQLAATLAQALSEGEPCPVCGAVHHPNPACATAGQDEEEACLVQRDQAQQQKASAQAALKAQDARLAELWADLQAEVPALQDIEAVPAFASSLFENGTAHNTQLKEMQTQLQTFAAKLAQLNDVEQRHNALKAALDKQKDEQTTLVAAQSHWQALCESRQRAVEEKEEAFGFSSDVDPKALEAEIARIERTQQRAAAQAAEAAARYQRAQMAQVQAEEAAKQAQQRLDELTAQLAADAAAFAQAWQAAFASQDDYAAAKADIAGMGALQQQLDSYAQNLTREKTLYEDLAERLQEDCSLHDLTASEKHCQDMAQQLSAAKDALAAHHSRYASNAKLIAGIRMLYEDFQALEVRYALIGKLRDVLDGKNRFNMKLETFAQAYYFEQMLAHANVRLARMTHGRYAFRRKDTVHDARKQAGLDLDVMDQYTGRARDVSTLSGGESFKASLSLALGLADVVSSESGGVELSTIFIDEGFGTLDEESLDDTVETLISLQDSGRLVGVISHVAELKERIPAHLVVSGGSGGSQAHFEVRE